MTYRQRKQAAINAHLLGVDIETIMKDYSFSESGLKLLLRTKNLVSINENYFNVDELECWICPAIDENILRKPRKSKEDERESINI